MLRMEQRLGQHQTQRLMLTQKMQQALQILQYSALELEQHVQEELETNPILEQKVVEPPAEIAPADEGTRNSEGERDDDGSFSLDDHVNHWEQRIKEGSDLSVNPDLADRRAFFENSITGEESLAARLISQLRLTFDDETDLAIGEQILSDISDRGYFNGNLEAIALELEQPLERVERVLYRIQKFEPTGVAARDVVECLLIQINAVYPEESQLRELVENHLEDLENRQIPTIAKAMKIEPSRVEELKTTLSTLDPWPGLEYSSEPVQYVIPDLVVEKIEGEYIVALTTQASPELNVNRDYQVLAKDKSIQKDERSYLREKIEAARWLIRNIEQRQQTILKIGKAIMDIQHAFLDKGVAAIRPLTLQEIADIVGVHEATVSRTTRGKYVQTPQGLFELKYFFSTALKSDTGESQSSKSVQLTIKKIIEGEDKKKPLSDQKVANLLKEDGLSIARRTVTKYREALGIPATTKRKEY